MVERQSSGAAEAGVERFDAIIIGAGVSGLFELYRFREMGLTVRVYEEGGGVGGTCVGTAIRAHDSIRRATRTDIPSRKSCFGNGTGRNISRGNPKPSGT